MYFISFFHLAIHGLPRGIHLPCFRLVPDAAGGRIVSPSEDGAGGDVPDVRALGPFSRAVAFFDGGQDGARGVGPNHDHEIRVFFPERLIKCGFFFLEKGGQRDRGAQFAVDAHGLLKIDSLLAVIKEKLDRHCVERSILGIFFVSIVFVGARGLTEEDHVAGAAKGVACDADRLGHVLPVALRRRQGRSPDAGGERAGQPRPVALGGLAKIDVK